MCNYLVVLPSHNAKSALSVLLAGFHQTFSFVERRLAHKHLEQKDLKGDKVRSWAVGCRHSLASLLLSRASPKVVRIKSATPTAHTSAHARPQDFFLHYKAASKITSLQVPGINFGVVGFASNDLWPQPVSQHLKIHGNFMSCFFC